MSADASINGAENITKVPSCSSEDSLAKNPASEVFSQDKFQEFDTSANAPAENVTKVPSCSSEDGSVKDPASDVFSQDKFQELDTSANAPAENSSEVPARSSEDGSANDPVSDVFSRDKFQELDTSEHEPAENMSEAPARSSEDGSVRNPASEVFSPQDKFQELNTSAHTPAENISEAPARSPEDGSAKDPVSDVFSQEKIQELDTGYRILKEIIKQNKSTCWPFMEKVDVKGLGLWDYETRVKEPMWLNKIIEKFERREYPGITEFTRDFRTMVENCYRYNGTEHAISKRAKRLEMVFESKLALLKKDYREKTSLSVTSNGKYAVDMNGDSIAPVSRYGRIGNTREYATILDDNSAKLVYDFVRCEKTMLQEDEKKASYRERRQHEFLYQRIAAAWINSTIEDHADITCIKTCHLLPEVAFFLHLCETTLKLPELNMYQFERSLLVPEHSIYLSKIMTSLLCSYQERNQINQRPPMHFKTWNTRLKERLIKWFELVQKYNSYTAAAEKLGINVEFFQAFGWKNPFFSENVETFCDLKYNDKVQVLKALCDTLFPLQSIQNALLSLDVAQLQCMQLGKDYIGNVYIYFPQFCGDEVRVYRHREFGPLIPVELPEQIWVPSKPPSPIPDSCENSPLVNGHVDAKVAEDEDNHSTPNVDKVSSNGAVDSQGSLDGGEVIKDETRSEVPLSQADTSQESIADSSPTEKSENASSFLHGMVGEDSRDSFVEGDKTSVAGEQKSSQDDPNMDLQPTTGRRTLRVRKQTKRYEEIPASSPLKRSARKRDVVLQKNNGRSRSVSPKKRKRGEASKKVNKEVPAKYGNVDFEMLCDSVDAIQLLLSDLESQHTKENKSFYGRNALENHQELLDKVRWLYDELEPWNIKLQQARLTVQIQMKREHDEIQNSTKKIDLWTEELTNKNTYMLGDNLTISHIDSPMSSVASYDDDEDDYVHPYFTRKSSTPEMERQFDETLYEEERETLLPAALWELEEILKNFMKDLLKLADRTDLQENNPVPDGRRTRQKIKQQNKVLGKIITFAEKKVECHPSLLPILVPNSDVYDVVDMIFLQEETRLQEIAEENRQKRLGRGSKRQNLQKPKIEKVSEIKTVTGVWPKFHPANIPGLPPICIRMQNGRVYPATRLSDGRVIPIMREKNATAASSVEELIESTRKEIRKNTTNEIPTISLRGSKTPEKKPEQIVSFSFPNSVGSGTATLQSEPLPRQIPFNSSKVTVKRAPKRIIVTQPLQRVIPGGGMVQTRPVTVTHVVRSTPVRPIFLNGQRYEFVPGTPTLAMSQQSAIMPAGTQQTIPVIWSQPTTVMQPTKVVLTPVQVVNPNIKYQSSPVRTSNPGGVVFLPIQNCSSAGIAQRIGTAPVLGVITSPQRQLQFQPEQSKP